MTFHAQLFAPLGRISCTRPTLSTPCIIIYRDTGWVPCAPTPSEACSTPVSGNPNAYACGPLLKVCRSQGNFNNNVPTLDGCFSFCQTNVPGTTFVEYSPSGFSCVCITQIVGVVAYNPLSDLYAIGQPRTPNGTFGDCGSRRLADDQDQDQYRI